MANERVDWWNRYLKSDDPDSVVVQMDKEIERLREVLENISTVVPRERFPAVTALGYCRDKAREALSTNSSHSGTGDV